jgi:putative copper export protein
MAEPLQVGAKAALYIGVVLLVGAAVFSRWIALPPLLLAERARLRRGALLGAVLVCGGTALEAIDAVTRAAGALDASLLVPYLLETRHGNAVLARFALAALLLAVAGPLRKQPSLAGRLTAAVLGGALLLSISLVSHAGAQGSVTALLVDLLHLMGAAAWAGSLLYMASLLAWPAGGTTSDAMQTAARRFSTLGLAGITLIAATGVYAAVLRLPDPQALTRTPYGRTLLIKTGIVCAVAAIAALNRWVALPWMTRGVTPAPLRRLTRIESLLVLAVLVTAGVLVSQPLPEPPATVAGVLHFRETLGPSIVHGTIEGRGAEGFAVDLYIERARGARAARAPADTTAAVPLRLTMLDMVMAPLEGTLPQVGPSHYRGAFQLTMTGQWRLAIETPGGILTVRIPAEAARVPPPSVAWAIAGPGLAAVLLGASLLVAGLRRWGAGSAGTVLPVAAGIMLVLAGAGLVVRAVS